MTHVAGKGDRYRKVEAEKFNSNWDNIFGRKNAEIEEEGLREPIRYQYTEGDRFTFGGYSYFQEGSVRYLEYSVQYHPPTEDN
jgi:hypothetical protein